MEPRQLDPTLKLFRHSTIFIAAVTGALLFVLTGGRLVGQSTSPPVLTILSKDGRRPLPITMNGDQELVFLDDVASAFQLTIRDESLGAFTVGYKGKTILMTPDQPLASIAGRLVSLPAAPTRAGRRWLVPVEFINRALGVIYDTRLDLRKPSRLLIVGDLRVPRVVVRVDNSGPARLVIDASPPTTSTMFQDGNALNVKFDADALDVTMAGSAAGGLLRGFRVQEPATLVVELGSGFGAFRAATQPLETSTRLTIDVQPVQPQAPPALGGPANAAASNPPPDAAPQPLDLSALSQPAGVIRAIALDPGHGGEDEGVKGAAGTKEKDLVLSAALRIKAAIEGRLGIRVLLTRDEDRNVALAGRAALANNNKVDLFISLHANASFRKTATGASILYAAFDREEEESARTSLPSVRLPVFGGGLRDLDLVLWDLAQLRHLTRSEELARILEAQFRDKIPMSAHAVDRAPLDVLKSVNMPAVLIEMGYLTNAEQETRMLSAEFQNTLVQAVFDSVLRYRDLPASGTR